MLPGQSPKGLICSLVLPDPVYFLHCCNFWERQMSIFNLVLKRVNLTPGKGE